MIVSVKLLRARLLIHPIVFDQTPAAEDAIRPHDLFRVATRPACPPSAMSLRPAVERFLEDGSFYTQWWCVEKGISTATAEATSPFVTDHDLLAVLVAPQDQSEVEGKRDVQDKVLGARQTEAVTRELELLMNFHAAGRSPGTPQRISNNWHAGRGGAAERDQVCSNVQQIQPSTEGSEYFLF